MAYGTEIQEIMGRGYGEIGAPWRIAEERKSVGIGECIGHKPGRRNRTGLSVGVNLQLSSYRSARKRLMNRNRIILRSSKTSNFLGSIQARPPDTAFRRIAVPAGLMERIFRGTSWEYEKGEGEKEA